MIAWIEIAVFSSMWLAAAAAALTAAAARAMDCPVDPRALGLAASGALIVYNVDRLRDVARDRQTAPARTLFIEHHRTALIALTGASALAATAIAWNVGPAVAGLLTAVAGLGLLHRRLKAIPYAKAPYVAAAWSAVAVGLPALLAERPRHVIWVAAVLFGTILSNAIASGVRDREAIAARLSSTRTLALARAAAVAATLAALAGPEPALAVLPATAFVALIPFRAEERYRLFLLDGSLLAGALLAFGLL